MEGLLQEFKIKAFIQSTTPKKKSKIHFLRQRWLDAAATELDMEICGMDVLVDDQDKEFILEVNSSSIGFPARHAPEVAFLLISTNSK